MQGRKAKGTDLAGVDQKKADPGRFRHANRRPGEAFNIFNSIPPDSHRCLAHQDASKIFRETRQMQQIQGVKQREYLLLYVESVKEKGDREVPEK